MVKKSFESSVQEKQTRKKKRSTWVAYKPQDLLTYFLDEKGDRGLVKASEAKIDYSDIPPLSDEQIKSAKRVRLGRPTLGAAPRKMISIKIDPFVLEEIKHRAKLKGEKYQSLIHEILEDYLERSAA